MTAGLVVEYRALTNKVRYKKKHLLNKNVIYFHLDLSDELEAGKCRTGNCRLNFSDLDDVFSFSGPLVVKTTLDVSGTLS